MPFFLLILLGYLLKRWKVLSEGFLDSLNKFVYKLALPFNLLFSTATMNTDIGGNGKFLFYTFALTLLSFLIIWGVTELLYRDKALVGTLVQGGFRGNFALLGVPLATAVVGTEAAAPAAMAIAIVIPCYNILSVMILSARGHSEGKLDIRKILLGVVTNPLIIAAVTGMLISGLRIPLPSMALQTVSYMGSCATPLGLLSIGGLFNFRAATARLKPALYSTAIKLVVMPAAMVGLCWLLGFCGADLLLFFIMFGSPAAVSSYAMATELGGDGPLASNTLIMTTLFSSITLSLGIYLMRTVGWI